MAKLFTQKFSRRDLRLSAATLVVAAVTALGLTAITAQADATSPQARLQQLADNAALAGVTTLATSDARSEAERRDDAVKATHRLIRNIPGVDRQIAASISDLTVTVKLSLKSDSKPLEVASTARYVAPDQPANWSWASRQHFAAGPPPVVAAISRPSGF
jgi:hypothetical protein